MAEQIQDSIIKMSGIEPESIVDGPGFRYVIFVQGCPHHCKGCHNPDTHDPEGGYEISASELIGDIEARRAHLRGITLSGGEPLCQAESLLPVAEFSKNLGLSIMIYTGFTFEEIFSPDASIRFPDLNMDAIRQLIEISDILVDGRFEEEEKDLTLLFRGSRNQRLIDIKKTMDTDEIKLYEPSY